MRLFEVCRAEGTRFFSVPAATRAKVVGGGKAPIGEESERRESTEKCLTPPPQTAGFGPAEFLLLSHRKAREILRQGREMEGWYFLYSYRVVERRQIC
jgi:hypothetical protein